MSAPDRDLTDAETQRVVDWLKQPLEFMPDPIAPEPSIVEVRCRLAEAAISNGVYGTDRDGLHAAAQWAMTGIWPERQACRPARPQREFSDPPAPPPKPKDQPEG